jgi:hypothetical protein
MRELLPGLDKEAIRDFGVEEFGLKRSVDGFAKALISGE